MLDTYAKRMPHVTIRWNYISSRPNSSIADEAEAILKNIPDSSRVILLDETGDALTSPQWSEKLYSTAQDTVIIIGGAHGVDQSVFERADAVWSLSKLVFPHQIVRIILAEQLYRAWTIHIGHPYHHS